MKKILTMVACAFMFAAIFQTASAAGLDANKQKVFDALKTTVTISGKTVSLPTDLLNQAENYLKRDDVTITSDQADSIVDLIEAAQQLIKDANATKISDLSPAQKGALLKIIKDAGEIADLTVVTDAAKNTITVLSGNQIVATDEPALKVTGANATSFAIISGFVVLTVVGCFFAARKAKLFAK